MAKEDALQREVLAEEEAQREELRAVEAAGAGAVHLARLFLKSREGSAFIFQRAKEVVAKRRDERLREAEDWRGVGKRPKPLSRCFGEGIVVSWRRWKGAYRNRTFFAQFS